jgi:hypothetical protein
MSTEPSNKKPIPSSVWPAPYSWLAASKISIEDRISLIHRMLTECRSFTDAELSTTPHHLLSQPLTFTEALDLGLRDRSFRVRRATAYATLSPAINWQYMPNGEARQRSFFHEFWTSERCDLVVQDRRSDNRTFASENLHEHLSTSNWMTLLSDPDPTVSTGAWERMGGMDESRWPISDDEALSCATRAMNAPSSDGTRNLFASLVKTLERRDLIDQNFLKNTRPTSFLSVWLVHTSQLIQPEQACEILHKCRGYVKTRSLDSILLKLSAIHSHATMDLLETFHDAFSPQALRALRNSFEATLLSSDLPQSSPKSRKSTL